MKGNSLEERQKNFEKEVYSVGGTTYTKQMLTRFLDHWSEPDRGKKQKMRWEKEKTWDLKRRLAKWARNNFDGIVCYLTDSERTIQQKRRDFAIQLEPYLEKYGRDMLNAFWSYYAMPENKPDPTYLRFEKEEFWDLSTRLEQWKQRNELPPFK